MHDVREFASYYQDRFRLPTRRLVLSGPIEGDIGLTAHSKNIRYLEDLHSNPTFQCNKSTLAMLYVTTKESQFESYLKISYVPPSRLLAPEGQERGL